MKKYIYKNKNIFFILLLSLTSLIFNFYYGYRGVFPRDSFLIFDSGYNILNGQHPFKDYWSITGPALDYIQALFFLIFGSSWFTYVLHASVINLVLAIFSYSVFKALGLKESFSFIYSVGISLLAYPIIGVPFIDHHSIIFSILSIYCFILAIKLEKNFLFFLIPILLGIAFLSKQIPAGYIIIFVSLMLLSETLYNFQKKKIYYILVGLISFLIIIFLFFQLNQIPINNFLLQYIFYPLSIGTSRIEDINLNFDKVFFQFKFIYISLLPLIVIFFKIITKEKKNLNKKKDLMVIFLIIGSSFIFIYTQIITQNQILIFFLIPMITGFSHVFYQKHFKNKYFIYVFIIVCLFSVSKYHIRFNEDKKFMELSNVNINLSVNAGALDEKLDGLQWITKYYPLDPQKEIDFLIEIKEYLKLDIQNKILISDYQFFSTLLNLKFSSPNKWYDGISIPNSKNKYNDDYKNFFIKKLKENKVEKIYTIGHKEYLTILSTYVLDIINNKCITSEELNEMLIIYDIKNCNL